ncbi:hypothetical protein [Otoolea muris]|uniref:hypothetical protein n=1 Tax=Otoolea muris TaxID=2941515 RepID=UPI00203FD7AF|nr:hypothetical protein [Otoolea muris]
MAAAHIIMAIGAYGCKRDLWKKRQRKVNMEPLKMPLHGKIPGNGIPYLRFIRLPGDASPLRPNLKALIWLLCNQAPLLF